ncbi:MAG: NADH-quinone oxidoreductase subunit NuoF [Acetobacteraceae bacterium]|nr:NADH-quinone oxidoreductase subunit NuoF [Acetobacteraceae bacterium]
MRLTLANFKDFQNRLAQKAQAKDGLRLIVGLGTCGVAAGGREVLAALEAELGRRGLRADIARVGCIGLCEAEVLVDVERDGERWSYGNMTPDRVPRLVEEEVVGGRRVEDWLVGLVGTPERPYPGLQFYAKQRRVVLKNCGFIDPENIEDYIAHGGYSALVKALSAMSREEIIAEVKRSGLRGRGGAGFPTGLKWEFTAGAPGDKKYVVCNGDEGDPGAFMDRSVMEGDPHSVIEGMIIAAFAIGADEGYLYVRAEYPLAVARLRLAISQAEDLGILGDGVLGTGFNFHLKIKEGAGAFVCGEETALLASIQGERGMPRPRPPFPAIQGLWGKPTNINNVETYANVPTIILGGGDAFAAVGTERSKGTKVFALTGKIARTGLPEVPMGLTLRELIFEVGGGIKEGRGFKAVQIGGPSGGCLPESLLDTPIEYDSLTQAGAMMGSGGLVVLDDRTCMVDLARFFLNFVQSESCGKCVPCREGTRRMLEMLVRFTRGEGRPGDLERLEELAQVVKESSLCGLGQTAPNPVLTTLRYFREEYEAHVLHRRCPAGVCRALCAFYIDPSRCKGCGKCLDACASGAISGVRKEPHVIDPARCIRCGACEAACAFGAVLTGSPDEAPAGEASPNPAASAAAAPGDRSPRRGGESRG